MHEDDGLSGAEEDIDRQLEELVRETSDLERALLAAEAEAEACADGEEFAGEQSADGHGLPQAALGAEEVCGEAEANEPRAEVDAYMDVDVGADDAELFDAAAVLDGTAQPEGESAMNTNLYGGAELSRLSSVLGGYDSDEEECTDRVCGANNTGGESGGTEVSPAAATAVQAAVRSAAEATLATARDGIALSPGCVVTVVGLQRAAHLNRQRGVVRQLDSAYSGGRWEVELLFRCGCREVKAVREENLIPEAATSTSKLLAADLAMSVELCPGAVVRVAGLQKAQYLNGRCGLVLRPDSSQNGRWEVELHLVGGGREIKAIRAENLVLEDDTDVGRADAKPVMSVACDAAVHGDAPVPLDDPVCENVEVVDGMDNTESPYSGECVVEGEEDKEAKEEENEAPSESYDEEEDTDVAPLCLQIGDLVQLEGLKAATHLNGSTGHLEEFDAAMGRWKVRLLAGTAAAVRPENLRLEASADKAVEQTEEDGLVEEDEADIPMHVDPAGEAQSVSPTSHGSDEYLGMDANELAAKALQAELAGDTEKAMQLNANIAVLRAGRGNVAGNGGSADISTAAGVSTKGPEIEEMIEVPEELVGRVIGVGGETIKKLSAESGARLSFNKADPDRLDPARVLLACGQSDTVAKARRLLAAVLSEAQRERGRSKKGKGKGGKRGGVHVDLGGGAAGCEAGICKWFAAGFCRNRPQRGACHNGLHDGAAALRAEAAWVGEGPQMDAAASESRPILLLLDLEGGGNTEGRDGEDEIIEMPVLAMCGQTGQELGRFHRFVRPGYWDRENASMRQRHACECFNPASAAEPFPRVVSSLLAWIGLLLGVAVERIRATEFLFVTCGNWDVKTALPRQCCNPTPGTVDVATQQLLFGRWCNLKEVFRDHYRLSDRDAPTGMRGMLRRLRISLSGQHHLGMDDVTNLSKIMKVMISEGARMSATGHAKNFSGLFGAGQHGGKFGSGKGSKKGCRSKKGVGADKSGGGKGRGKGIHVPRIASPFDFPPQARPSIVATAPQHTESPPDMSPPQAPNLDMSPPARLPFGVTLPGDLKRPADGPPSGSPPRCPVRRVSTPFSDVSAAAISSSTNPWGGGSSPPLKQSANPQHALLSFLKRAPIPGKEWLDEDEEYVEEDVRKTRAPGAAGSTAGQLQGVLDGPGLQLRATEPAATPVSTLLASLPPPRAAGSG